MCLFFRRGGTDEIQLVHEWSVTETKRPLRPAQSCTEVLDLTFKGLVMWHLCAGLGIREEQAWQDGERGRLFTHEG